MGNERFLRISLSLFVGFFAFLAFLFTFLLFGESELVKHTMENNRAITASFEKSSVYVDQYIFKNGRLPSRSEFDKWKTRFQAEPHSPYGMVLLPDDFPVEVTNGLAGSTNRHHYVISYWRGEWWEHYASWSKKSTIPVSENAYYLFGNWYLGWISFLLLTGALGYLCVRIWPRKERK